MEGPGVALPKHKDLDRLGDKYKTLLEQRAETSTEITKVEGRIADAMSEKGLTRYVYSDQEMILKPGKTHIRIKTIKAEGVEANGESDE